MPEVWERIDGKQAVEIELLNYDNQVNFIKSLFYFWERCAEKTSSPTLEHPTEEALKDLHRLGTLLLLEKPGCYRDHGVEVVNRLSKKRVYEAPHFTQVPSLVEEMFSHLDSIWDEKDGHEVAAYLLWRINWIHPFPNGNGRTARGFAYACLCLKSKCYLPGKETVIDLIKKDREPLYKALREADAVYKKTGEIDVSQLSEYLLSLYFQQLVSAGIKLDKEDLSVELASI